MKFKLKPILSEIKELYLKPISITRFQEYISKLQGGTKGDLVLPISGFNPMAKEHIITKIEELEHIGTESIMEKIIEKFNSRIDVSNQSQKEILVVLNLADDLKGAWTNYYSTDFDSKFKLNAFVKRNFCIPYFWTSEFYTQEIIESRTVEYMNRTIFRFGKQDPKSLEEHLDQEIFVSKNTLKETIKNDKSNFKETEAYYFDNKYSEENDLIFNFFYGDKASESLGYKQFGNKDHAGFKYARFIAS